MQENLLPNSAAAGSIGFWRIMFAVAAGAALFVLLGNKVQTDFANLALGSETQAVYGDYQGDRIHCSTIKDAEMCLEPAASRGYEKFVLWLGNSQLYAINQYQDGQRTAPVILAEKLRPHNIEVLGFSLANASFREHYLTYEWIAAQRSINTLILPVVFDDTRELRVREQVAVGFADESYLEDVDWAAIDVEPTDHGAAAKSAGDAESVVHLRDTTENALNGSLEQSLGFNTLQANLRNEISVNLFYLRNTVLGIDPTTKRPMIPDAYRVNMNALQLLLSAAQKRGTDVLVYVAPIRSDIDRPYFQEEYERFLDDVKALAAKHGAKFTDLAELVPGPVYGMKDATRFFAGPEYDFMHFRAEGHKLLSDAVRDVLQASDS